VCRLNTRRISWAGKTGMKRPQRLEQTRSITPYIHLLSKTNKGTSTILASQKGDRRHTTRKVTRKKDEKDRCRIHHVELTHERERCGSSYRTLTILLRSTVPLCTSNNAQSRKNVKAIFEVNALCSHTERAEFIAARCSLSYY
jgi:hypothetical protein